jgi:recombination protein RecT
MATANKEKFELVRQEFQLPSFLSAIRQVTPNHVSAERIVRLALDAINRQPELLLCQKASLMRAVLDAGQLGLEPSSVLGTAYLIPFREKQKDGSYQYICQLVVGYKGLIDLSRRSGQVLNIEARLVYEGDEFDYEYGTKPFIHHKPRMVGGLEIDERTGEIHERHMLSVYSVAFIRDANPQFEIMSKMEVDAIRAKSRSKDSFAWKDHYAQMARKCPIRRLSNYIPRSPELASALEIDSRSEGFGEFIELPSEDYQGQSGREDELKNGTDRLKQRLSSRRTSAINPGTPPQPQDEKTTAEAVEGFESPQDAPQTKFDPSLASNAEWHQLSDRVEAANKLVETSERIDGKKWMAWRAKTYDEAVAEVEALEAKAQNTQDAEVKG